MVLLLMVPAVMGLMIDTTSYAGESPVLYGEYIAYERDSSIVVYDMARHEEREIAPGRNPSLFGFLVAYERDEDGVDLNEDGDTDDVVIQYANVRDGKVTNVGAAGKNPYIFATFIVFSTAEQDLGIDFSNDGDVADDIVQLYDLDAGTVENLKAVGDVPVMNQESLLFVTEEAQIGVDLNADEDKSDDILRVFDRETRQVGNTKLVASRPVLRKSGRAVFASEGEIVLFDAKAQKPVRTEVQGANPTMSGDVIIFEREGELYGMLWDSLQVSKLNVAGSAPSLFDDRVAFVSPEGVIGDVNKNGKLENIVRYAKAEDRDEDDVSDFVDNCPATANEDQQDGDNDGVGDACDKPEAVEPVLEPEAANASANESAPVQESETSWYWLLLLVLLIPFVVWWGPKYYRKRKKSFGF